LTNSDATPAGAGRHPESPDGRRIELLFVSVDPQKDCGKRRTRVGEIPTGDPGRAESGGDRRPRPDRQVPRRRRARARP